MRLTFLTTILLMGCQDNVIGKMDNALPSILIVSHSNNFEAQDGYSQSFYATVSDDNHAYEDLTVAWYLDDDVVCATGPVTDAGESFCEITFFEGDQKVIAEVRDPEGAGGRAELNVNVLPSAAPVVEILTPQPDDLLYSNQLINFSAYIDDAEDDREDLFITWTSTIDGAIPLENTFDTSGEVSDFAMLSYGQHAIELRVEDTTGKVTTDEVVITVGGDNIVPYCEITAPTDGNIFTLGETINFSGLATDQNIPSDQLDVEWISDKDGTIGYSIPTTQGDVSFGFADLTDNSHTITMRVTDDVGATCTDQVLISFTSGPTVTIDSPQDGDIVDFGSTVLFEGTVSDAEDDPYSILVDWYSSRDGELYMGSPFANGLSSLTFSDLSAGTHVISFGGEDTDGYRGEDVIVLIVNHPPEISNLNMTPSSPADDEVVICSATATDLDGNATINFEFFNLSTGAQYPATSMTSGTSSLNLANTSIVEGDTLQCLVTATDDRGSTTTAYTTAVVGSETPNFTSNATITPNTGVVTGSALLCSASATQTNVGAITPTFEWSIAGNIVGTGTTLGLTSSNSNVGDTVTCTATAVGNTGVTATSSDSVVIDNSAPVISSSSITPNPAYEDSIITCSVNAVDADDDTLSYTFFFTNTTSGLTYGAGTQNGNTSTLNIATLGVPAGQTIECAVSISDGNGGNTSVTESVTISSDPAPTFTTGATINPSSGVYLDTLLSCSATAVNGTTTYEWYNGGTLLGTGTSFQLSNSNSSINDTITCTATATSPTGLTATSSDSVLIENRAPSVNAYLSHTGNQPTGTTLTCNATAGDPDEGTLTPTYTWYVNGSPISNTASTFTTNVSDSPIGSSVSCMASVTDNQGVMAQNGSASVTIVNAPATLGSVYVSCLTFGGGCAMGSAAQCSYSVNDPDQNATIDVEWFKRTGSSSGPETIVATNTDWYTPTSSTFNNNDWIGCRVTVTDPAGTTTKFGYSYFN